MSFDELRKVGVINTLRFNWRYFKWRVLKPKVLCSRNVIFKNLGGKVSIENPTLGGVKIGFGRVGIIDEKREKTIWENSGEVCFQAHARLDIGTRIVCSSMGTVSFGESVQIMGRTSIICYKGVAIGDNCLISWDNLLMDTDFHRIYEDENSNKRINPDQEIAVGNHVWIGCRCTILKGTLIPDNSVIAAGSTVTKKLEMSNAVYIDNTAKKKCIEWKA